MNDVPLDAIGLEQGTDKSSSHHDYLQFYERFFAPMRHVPLTILEIGVLGGASLRTWETYFPQARVIGADINPLSRRHHRGRVEIEIMDQSNLEDLVRVASQNGPFDIVVEDGSHLWDDQILTLKTLFPFIRAGGLYAVEDLQTNYGVFEEKYRAGAACSCMEFIKRWLDLHVADDVTPLNSIEDPFLRTYARAATAFNFNRRLCLIEKRGVPRPPGAVLFGPLSPSASAAPGLRIGVIAHCSHAGDIYGPAGYVDLGSDRFALQGLAIETEAEPLEYRVRGPDGTWSPWVAAPGFAGTRGRALELTGVAFRLLDGARDRYTLRVTARYTGHTDLVVALDGEDCLPPPGAASSLRAIQVELTRAVSADADTAAFV